MTAVLRRTLAVERQPLIGWTAGIALLVLVTAGSWPAVRDSGAQLDAVMENMPAALTAFLGEGIASFSAAGIVGSRLFGSIGLAVFIAFGVSRGSRAVAGEEATGTLELLVTQPISRTSIAVDKVVAALGTLAGLVVVQQVLLLVMMPLVGLDFAVDNVVAASIGLYVVSAVFGMLAFAIGAATGNRQLAVGVGAGVAGGMFLLNGLGALIEELRPLADLTPFHHFDGTLVLSRGVAVVPMLVMAALTVLLTAAGILIFDRRDLS